MRKIGLFGGTFDPVHNAHIEIAKAAKKQLGLDFVIMLTGGNPPHKRQRTILDAKIRHIMLKKAVSGYDCLIPCDWEVKRKAFSYTADTLEYFKHIYPHDKLYFIMGGDSLDYFDEWYMPEKIVQLCTLAVYGRGSKHSFEYIENKFGIQIAHIDGEYMNVSSTQMRENAALIKNNTPSAVADFIEKYGLYKEKKSDMEILTLLLSESRLKHSIGVSDMAAALAEHYGEDAELLRRAGLLHDAAKCIQYEAALGMCDELEAELDPLERTIPGLVHPKLGAELVKCLFGINEGVITSAIRCHTVGKRNMSTADKIIFVADMCEENRSFAGVDDIRKAAFENINKAVVMCIDATVRFNSSKGGVIHPMAYAVRDELCGILSK